jgi:A/G-specific adenine glycosylase
MPEAHIDDFWRTVSQFYSDFGRHDMLWRQPEADGSFDPYKIIVSELMLQQTQVSRVTPKFCEFIATFPTLQLLANAHLGEVLQLWNGLGYNRRAKFLWQAAQTIMRECDGVFPQALPELLKLPGVGPNTAGAILAYAFNQPVVYVETNIRTVVIHHFFHDKHAISDAAIREVLVQILRKETNELTAREFYWAMMDYGAYLKKTVGNLNHASDTFSKQSTFRGSRRQLRGQVIRLLSERPYRIKELRQQLADERTDSVVADLLKEQMIVGNKGLISVS